MTDHATPSRIILLDSSVTPSCRIELRSNLNRELLGHVGEEGLVLWGRRANTRHVLTWAELARYAGEMGGCVTMAEKQEV